MSGPHLWQIRAVRDIVALAMVVGLLWLMLEAQWATVPILIGFGLAYLSEPVLKAAESKLGMARRWSLTLALIGLIAATFLFFRAVVPLVIDEAGLLLERLPKYINILRTEYGIAIPAVDEAVAGAKQDPQIIWDYLQPTLGWVGNVISQTTSSVLATVLTFGMFAFSSLNYERLPNLQRYFPNSRRDKWTEIVGKIEQVFAGFFRGQLVVAAFTTVVFSIGFYVADVPYWFVAAGVGGVFSIIPYGQASGWILAGLLSLLEAEVQAGPVDLVAVFLGPTIVYAVMQSLETFVITPLVQSSSTKLNPIAVFAAVIGGGSLGGLVGVFLAIPIVATGKILLQDVLLPKLRHWADNN